MEINNLNTARHRYILTKKEYEKAFPDRMNNDVNKIYYLGSLDFSLDNMQDFLNSYGYEMRIVKWQKKTRSYYNEDNFKYIDVLLNLIIAIPFGEEFPQLLEQDTEFGTPKEYFANVFKTLFIPHLLGLTKPIYSLLKD